MTIVCKTRRVCIYIYTHTHIDFRVRITGSHIALFIWRVPRSRLRAYALSLSSSASGSSAVYIQYHFQTVSFSVSFLSRVYTHGRRSHTSTACLYRAVSTPRTINNAQLTPSAGCRGPRLCAKPFESTCALFVIRLQQLTPVLRTKTLTNENYFWVHRSY